jgi:hypothetical protein
MDDAPDMGLGAGPVERGGTCLVYRLQRFAGSILKGAGAIDDRVDVFDMRPPGRGIGRASDVEPDMAQRNGTLRRAARNTDDAGAGCMQPTGDGRSNEARYADHEDGLAGQRPRRAESFGCSVVHREHAKAN